MIKLTSLQVTTICKGVGFTAVNKAVEDSRLRPVVRHS